MPGVYDNINQIKKQGPENIQLDSQGNVDVNNTNWANLNWDNIPKGGNTDMLRDTSQETFRNEPYYTGNILPQDWGKTQYDQGTNWREFQNRSLEDVRAARQSAWTKLGNGLFTGGVTALTTAGSAIGGFIAGLGNAVANPFLDKDPNTGVLEKMSEGFIKDPVSQWLNSVQQWADNSAKIYTSDDYRKNQANGDWLKNIWSVNTLTDLEQTAGFIGGMYLSGKIGGKLMSKATNIAGDYNLLRGSIGDAVKAGTLQGDVDALTAKAIATQTIPEGVSLTDRLAIAAKNVNVKGGWTGLVSSGLGSVGWAKNDALSNSQGYQQAQTEKLNSEEGQLELAQHTAQTMFQSNPNMFTQDPSQAKDISQLMSSVKPEYQQEFVKNMSDLQQKAENGIQSASNRIASENFWMMMPLVFGTQAIQFSKVFAKGYMPQRGFFNMVKSALGKTSIDEGAMEGADRIMYQTAQQLEDQAAGKAEVEAASKLQPGAGGYVVRNNAQDKIGQFIQATKGPMLMGNQMMGIHAVGEAARQNQGAWLNSYMGYKIDPDANANAQGLITSAFNALNHTYGNWANYEAYFNGMLLGAFGSPTVEFKENAEGKMRPKLGWHGSIVQDVLHAKEQNAQLKATADALTQTINRPDFKETLAGLGRHQILENAKTDAMEENDQFGYQNANHAQDISDIMTFQKAGKLQDLIDYVDGNIRDYSDPSKTKDLADQLRSMGQLAGTPEGDETAPNIYKDMTDDEIVKSALDASKSFRQKIDDYRDISKNLTALVGDRFSGEAANELVYLFSQEKNFRDRYGDMKDSLIKDLDNISKHNIGFFNKKFDVIMGGKKEQTTLRDIISRATPQELRAFVFGYGNVEGETFKGNGYMANYLTARDRDAATKQVIKDDLDKRLEQYSKLSQEEQDAKADEIKQTQRAAIRLGREIAKNTPGINDIRDRMVDMGRIEDARWKTWETYQNFINNPEALAEHLNKSTEEAIKQDDKNKSSAVADKIKAIDPASPTAMSDLRKILAEEKQKGTAAEINANKVIQRMGLKGTTNTPNPDYHQTADEYRKIQNAPGEIKSALRGNKDITEDERKGALELFGKMANRANSYDELMATKPTQDEIDSIGGRDVTYDPEEKQKMGDILQQAMQDARDYNQQRNSQAAATPPPPLLIPPGKSDEREESKPQQQPGKPGIVEGSEQPEPETIQEEPKQVLKINTDDNQLRNEEQDKIYSKWEKQIKDLFSDIKRKWGEAKQWIGGLIMNARSPEYQLTNNYLKSRGADKYVNSGKLVKGTKVYFMSSQDYHDYIKQEGTERGIKTSKGSAAEWVEKAKPLIMVVEDPEGTITSNGKSYQVVGTLSGGLNEALWKRMTDPKHHNEVDESIYSELKDSINGKLDFDNDKPIVSSFFGTTPWGDKAKPIFGVADAYNSIRTNDAVDEKTKLPIAPNQIEGVKDPGKNTDGTSKNAGRVYMLIRGAKGNFIPVAVRVRKLSEVNTDADNSLFNRLRSIVKTMADESLKDENYVRDPNSDIKNPFDIATGKLGDILYAGSDAGSPIFLRNDRGNYIQIRKGDKIIDVPVTAFINPDTGEITNRPAEDIAKELMQGLKDAGINFQVKWKQINKPWTVDNSKDYNDVLIESGILSTNLAEPWVHDASFTVKPLGADLKIKDEVVSTPKTQPQSIGTKPETSATPAMKQTTYKGNTYWLDSYGTILDRFGVPVKGQEADIIKRLDWYNNDISKQERQDRLFKIGDKQGFLYPDGNGYSLLLRDKDGNYSVMKDDGKYKAEYDKRTQPPQNPPPSINKTNNNVPKTSHVAIVKWSEDGGMNILSGDDASLADARIEKSIKAGIDKGESLEDLYVHAIKANGYGIRPGADHEAVISYLQGRRDKSIDRPFSEFREDSSIAYPKMKSVEQLDITKSKADTNITVKDALVIGRRLSKDEFEKRQIFSDDIGEKGLDKREYYLVINSPKGGYAVIERDLAGGTSIVKDIDKANKIIDAYEKKNNIKPNEPVTAPEEVAYKEAIGSEPSQPGILPENLQTFLNKQPEEQTPPAPRKVNKLAGMKSITDSQKLVEQNRTGVQLDQKELEDIQREIQETKKYQEENCPGILPSFGKL